MALIVQKYGGTSVGNPERIKNVAERVIRAKKQGHTVVVVVSAIGGQTDALIRLAQEVTPNPNKREMDMLLATGEQVSMALLSMALHGKGEKAVSLTGAQVGIYTDNSHTKARILRVKTDRIRKELRAGNIVIVAGFQGKTVDQQITTLGRGGSDLTAVALAAALKAKVCEIYTDVDGVYTTDPRIVSEARKIEVISYDEMLELASLGAKVMHSRSVEVGKKYNVPIMVRSSLNNAGGTLITKEVKAMESVLIRGVALNLNEAKITLFSVPDRPGVAAKIFKFLADDNINVDMIIQNKTTTKSTDISFTVYKNELNAALKTVHKAGKHVGAKRIICDENTAKVSIVGVGMRSHSGVASRMFGALAKNKINIDMISTSEIKISVVVPAKFGKKAVQVLHEEFELSKKQILHDN